MNKNKLGILVNIDTAIGNDNWKGANPNSIDKFSWISSIIKSENHCYRRLLNNNMFGIFIIKKINLIKNEKK